MSLEDELARIEAEDAATAAKEQPQRHDAGPEPWTLPVGQTIWHNGAPVLPNDEIAKLRADRAALVVVARGLAKLVRTYGFARGDSEAKTEEEIAYYLAKAQAETRRRR